MAESASNLHPEVLAAILGVVVSFFGLAVWVIKRTIDQGFRNNERLINSLVKAVEAFERVEEREASSHTAIMDALQRIMDSQSAGTTVLAQISETQGRILALLSEQRRTT